MDTIHSKAKKLKSYQLQAGFTLIEVLIALSLFTIFATSIFFTYGSVLEVLNKTRNRTLATTLLNREIEFVRDLKYEDVGISGGYPVGVLEAQKVVVYENVHFLVKAYVRNIDNPFDGTTGGSPNDTAPADYRLLHLEIECPTCYGFVPVEFTTWVAPQNLETTTNNGSLFINVFDASGVPVANTNVTVTNTSTSPNITITDTTNASGILQLVDIPTSTVAYQITVTKSGYSSAKTYKPGEAANPNPIQPHATITSQTITEISFAIDRTSTINVSSHDDVCTAVGSFDFNLNGAKLIGSGPDVLKYSQAKVTNSTGSLALSSMEWDSYQFIGADSAYDIAGTIPLSPMSVDPNVVKSFDFVLEQKASTSLLVTVIDASSSPLSGASVNIAKTGTNLSKVTGERFFNQTDWSGSQYASQDGNIDDANPSGEIRLIQSSSTYPTSTNSFLISNTFDAGTANADLQSISWSPTSQSTSTTLQFQIASNSDNSTWNFIGPDGTSSTFYTATSTISTLHQNQRYFRYQTFLNTTDPNATPRLTNIDLGFTSTCVPQAQAFFSGIPTGTYAVTVSKSGFTTATSSISVVSGWQEAIITL